MRSVWLDGPVAPGGTKKPALRGELPAWWGSSVVWLGLSSELLVMLLIDLKELNVAAFDAGIRDKEQGVGG